MDPKLVDIKENPRERAGLVNKLFFWWIKEIFSKGFHRQLTLSDIYRPLRSDESERLGNRVEVYWKEQAEKLNEEEEEEQVINSRKLSSDKDGFRLARALFRAFWPEHLYLGLLLFVEYGVLNILHPILQCLIIDYFKIDNDTKRITELDALIYAACLMVCILLIVFVQHHSDIFSLQLGMKLRVACSTLIYRKIIRLNKRALAEATPGQIVNLLSNDVARFDEVVFYLNFFWITPVQMIIIASILWQKIGIFTLIILCTFTLIALPLYSVFVKMSGKMRKMIAILTDKRIQLTNELITGMQVVKMYAWEEPFAKIIGKIRAAEIKKIKFTSYVRATSCGFLMFTTRAALFLTLVSLVMTGNDLNAEVAYLLSTYIQTCQLTATHFFPTALILASETMVSIRRLEKFLLLKEHQATASDQTRGNSILKSNGRKVQKDKVESIRRIDANDKVASWKGSKQRTPVSIVLDHVSANWTPKQLPPSVCNVSATIRSGQLCALVGPVGSGKSSLLHLLLNELPVGAGCFRIERKPGGGGGGGGNDNEQKKQGYVVDTSDLNISYASQEPWLFSGTIRENILFGQPYDKERYIAVTKACALSTDFRQLPRGDMSNVGEGGSLLSGGQRARVNLARAVYKRADLYLLDDPLSAVDARVAKHLFRKCIEGYLHGETRILVTHQLQFVKRTDIILVLDKGCVKMQGSYEELSKSSQDFNELINHITSEARKQQMKNSKEIPVERPSKISCRVSVTSNSSSLISYDYEEERFEAKEEDEAIASGRVAGKVYKEYCRHAGSYYALFGLCFIVVLSETSTIGTDYWLSYWVNLETIRKLVMNQTGAYSHEHGYDYMFNDTFLSGMFTLDDNGLAPSDGAIYVYTFCIVSCIVTILVRNLFFMKICTDAANNLHNSMLSNVLGTLMSFFHDNPSGRILNRFSKDVGAMDETLPRTMLETFQIFLVVFGVLVMIVVVNYWMMIPLVILFVLFYQTRLLYLKVAQNVKRLEGVAKSPVFSHINATVAGLTTIRTSGSEVTDLLQKQFNHLQDVHTGAWYTMLAVSAAFGLLLDLATCFFVGCVCYSFILFKTDDMLGGDVGLAISQSMILIGVLQYGVKQSSNMVLQVTSIERILQYTDLPKEAPRNSDNPPPADWPEHGQLTLRDVSLKYKKSETPVLKNLNVTIEAGWKVGVVGRTGAGKSSLISALFRLFDEGFEGEIKIDGRDTKTLGLRELRSRLSIIPQQPFLFSESLRYNLDPFDSYDDTLLWESLRQVEMNDHHLLEQKLTQNGSNLSTGERQLICLARAILRNNRILILDEATANIDSRTDALIQNTIRTRFANCTVITIAHRLLTIIDSDKIIAMDDGRIAEFGCAHELLRDKPTGIFSRMVNNTNAAMAQTLRSEAEKAYLRMTDESSRRSSNETDTVSQSEL